MNMSIRRFKYSVISLALSLLLVSGAQAVGAQSDPAASPEAEPESRAIAFYPEETGFGTFITVELEPGESIDVPVTIGNSGNVEQTIRTYAVSAQSGINGGFVLSEYGAETDLQTAWLEYPEQEFTFAPGEGLNIDVEITVPEGTAAGEYVTAIAAEQAEAFAVEGTAMSNQRVRWSIPLLIVVPGESVSGFEIGDAELTWQSGSLYGLIEITNIGNRILRPTGEVRLINSDASVVGVSSIALDSIYTGTSTHFVVGFHSVPEAESYGLKVVLDDPETDVRGEKSFTDVVPVSDPESSAQSIDPLNFSEYAMVPIGEDVPPTMLQFKGAISNNASEPIENARVSIVTYQDGIEVDRYPIMQAVTIQTDETPIEARYSLPGGFTDGTYTFEVTIELGSGDTQTVLVTQEIDYEIVVGD